VAEIWQLLVDPTPKGSNVTKKTNNCVGHLPGHRHLSRLASHENQQLPGSGHSFWATVTVVIPWEPTTRGATAPTNQQLEARSAD